MEAADPLQVFSFGILSTPGFPGYPFMIGLQLILNGLFGVLLVV